MLYPGLDMGPYVSYRIIYSAGDQEETRDIVTGEIVPPEIPESLFQVFHCGLLLSYSFQMDYCKSDVIGEFPAACCQYSFLTNFRIYRLNFAWIINEMLVTSTMTVTEFGVEKGWVDLRSFVPSVRF